MLVPKLSAVTRHHIKTSSGHSESMCECSEDTSEFRMMMKGILSSFLFSVFALISVDGVVYVHYTDLFCADQSAYNTG